MVPTRLHVKAGPKTDGAAVLPEPFTDAAVAKFLTSLGAAGHLSPSALERAERAAATSGTRIDKVLRPLGLVSDEAYFASLLFATGLPALESDCAVDCETLHASGLPFSFLERYRCLPVAIDEHSIILAIEDPFDTFVPAAVAARSGRLVAMRLLAPGQFDLLATELQEGRSATVPTAPDVFDPLSGRDDVERLRDLASDAPVIRLVNAIIERAVDDRASDVHLTSTTGGGSRLRFRLDGVLAPQEPPPAGLHFAVISRIKIMAGLDIAERRLPQDGRLRVSARGRPIDIRVATMPHVRGEGLVLRILDRTNVRLDFDALGLSEPIIAAFKDVLRVPHGLVLVTGPTGSGKSTTLYTALTYLESEDRNIVTIEDPVEFDVEGVNQIEVSSKTGLDFADALRSVLRQDPDIIMVGEIRDGKTASVAVQAALTGHLVLATVHTNTAAGAIPRLIDMGVESYLLASTLKGVLSQRLVRRLCARCRRANGPLEFQADGCSDCGNTGYRGRLAAAEFLTVSSAVVSLIRDGSSELELETTGGLVPLMTDALAKVHAGLTTRDEVGRLAGHHQ